LSDYRPLPSCVSLGLFTVLSTILKDHLGANLIRISKGVQELSRITVTTGSSEALLAFRRQPEDFGLVITDYTVPKMTGTNLAEQIVQIRPGNPIIPPVQVLTKGLVRKRQERPEFAPS
jgi:CheY-like chemotaxis protein